MREESKDNGVTMLQDHADDGSHKEVVVEVELFITTCLDDPHDMLVHGLSLTTIHFMSIWPFHFEPYT